MQSIRQKLSPQFGTRINRVIETLSTEYDIAAWTYKVGAKPSNYLQCKNPHALTFKCTNSKGSKVEVNFLGGDIFFDVPGTVGHLRKNRADISIKIDDVEIYSAVRDSSVKEDFSYSRIPTKMDWMTYNKDERINVIETLEIEHPFWYHFKTVMLKLVIEEKPSLLSKICNHRKQKVQAAHHNL